MIFNIISLHILINLNVYVPTRITNLIYQFIHIGIIPLQIASVIFLFFIAGEAALIGLFTILLVYPILVSTTLGQ